MIKTDYSYSSIKLEALKIYEKNLNEIVETFTTKKCRGNDYIGWYEYPKNIDQDLIRKIKEDSKKIKKMCDVFVVCGIGGSYLGARAVIEAIKGFKNQDIEIVYVGNTFDEVYLNDVISYLKDKEFCVNVISKSGTTLETAVAFRFLKNLLKDKYGDEYSKRVFVTTDKSKGCLKQMADMEGYTAYSIPDDVGGRYSVFTPVGLLPMAVAGVDFEAFVEGAKKAFEDLKERKIEKNIAYQYAAYRYMKYLEGKKVEVFSAYSPYLGVTAEWWKQLFGESEGKEEKGLFPSSVNFSTDLHSLGQFIQQGSKILFLTQLRVFGKNNLFLNEDVDNVDNLNYLLGISVNEMNLSAQEGTNKAHHGLGKVDNFTLELSAINENTLGYLMFFFMFSCMLSANLLGVNAFDQPGVEFYKTEMKKILKNKKVLQKNVD